MGTHTKLSDGARVAIIGADGMLGRMVAALAPSNVELILCTLPEFDIAKFDVVSAQLSLMRPDFIINCAAVTDVDGCESRPEQAYAVNADGPGHLAMVAAQIDATLMHISTDFVFSGTRSTLDLAPYDETHPPEPISIYGASKRQGEIRVETSPLHDYFIVRTSWLYGPWGKNFVETIIRLAHEREILSIISDQVGTPTFTGDLASVIWALLKTDHYGLYHYSNAGQCSWYEFACEIVECLQQRDNELKVKQVKPIATEEYSLPAKRPAYSVLSKDKIVAATGIVVPSWRWSLRKYLDERNQSADD
ncbi:MAG: dTDP-4-dehydrorhamnose reductase [Desulfuromonadaceae bacterium]|nr:dTDP-4-dehydrorhamnose reductase [Desulfuromonas sp.]MDY0185596.1 dTDP-4-dehydrorhamnose reductase [Desulfuromonadaceae bacterium]